MSKIVYTTLVVVLLTALCLQCKDSNQQVPAQFHIAGAMKNVMWKGQLGGIIALDTIAKRGGLYAVGPLAGLRGEITIFDGRTYTSRVGPSDSLIVEADEAATAPFLVYANQTEWKTVPLPAEVKDLKTLEAFVNNQSAELTKPFVFRLSGSCQSANIHCQNLAPGSQVSSPEEAHAGQVNYLIENQKVDIVCFYSTEHQGIFTHHDTYVHPHLITKDRKMMGHLDAIDFSAADMVLELPRQ